MRAIFLLCLATTLSGCATSPVSVVPRGMVAEKPGNVWVYLSVAEEDKALDSLPAESFEIYEDDQLIPPDNSRQVLLDKDVARAHRAVVIVDHSTAADEEVREELANALSFFVERVRQTQPISIYAFDGRKDLRLVAELSQEDEAKDEPGKKAKAKKAEAMKEKFKKELKPADTSRNLNGAIVQGLEKLDEAYEKEHAKMRAGTLIVFSGGPDLAGRVSDGAVAEALSESKASIITVGFGDSAPQLVDYGKNGYVDAHSQQTLSMAFEEAGYLVRDDYQRHYLLSYCSPARAGKRRLRVDVVKGEGEEALRGSSGEIDTFSASGFSEGCDPTKKPDLKVKN